MKFQHFYDPSVNKNALSLVKRVIKMSKDSGKISKRKKSKILNHCFSNIPKASSCFSFVELEGMFMCNAHVQKKGSKPGEVEKWGLVAIRYLDYVQDKAKGASRVPYAMIMGNPPINSHKLTQLNLI